MHPKQPSSKLVLILFVVSILTICQQHFSHTANASITTTTGSPHYSTPRTKHYENSLPFHLMKIQELNLVNKFKNSNKNIQQPSSKPSTTAGSPPVLTNNENAVVSHPVWPLQFNATLLKITPFDHDIQWTKLYYDFKNQLGRFDFFDSYYDMKNEWGATNFTILWWNSTVWYLYPKSQECWIRSKTLPLISPHWLQMTNYLGRQMFRGLYSDVWQFPNVDDLDGMQYYHRVADKMEDRTPLRSTNQANDPGATDYVDFIIGPSDFSLYKVPSYCPK